MSIPCHNGAIHFDHALDGGESRTLAEDVRAGLSRPFKELPPKHLYDSRGAALFDQICELPEYYPTRTERSILEHVAGTLVERTGACERAAHSRSSCPRSR